MSDNEVLLRKFDSKAFKGVLIFVTYAPSPAPHCIGITMMSKVGVTIQALIPVDDWDEIVKAVSDLRVEYLGKNHG